MKLSYRMVIGIFAVGFLTVCFIAGYCSKDWELVEETPDGQLTSYVDPNSLKLDKGKSLITFEYLVISKNPYLNGLMNNPPELRIVWFVKYNFLAKTLCLTKLSETSKNQIVKEYIPKLNKNYSVEEVWKPIEPQNQELLHRILKGNEFKPYLP